MNKSIRNFIREFPSKQIRVSVDPNQNLNIRDYSSVNNGRTSKRKKGNDINKYCHSKSDRCFIDQISKIRTILKGVSISALILAPLAIVLFHLFLSELILSHFYPSHNQLTSHMPSADSVRYLSYPNK